MNLLIECSADSQCGGERSNPQAEPKFRFYALYDRVCRKDVLEAAFKHVGKRGKAAGVDGVKAEEILDGEGARERFMEERAHLYIFDWRIRISP